MYNKFSAITEGFNDADWNSHTGDVVSTSGYVFLISGGVVSWKSKKHIIIAKSTMEAELVALARRHHG